MTTVNLGAVLLLVKAKKFSIKIALAVFGLLLIGMLYGESSIAVPVAIMAVYVLLRPVDWKEWLIPPGLMLVVYFFIRLIVVRTPIRHPEFAPIAEAPLLTRLLTIPSEITSYLWLVVFPRDLAISKHYLVTSITSPAFILPLLFGVVFFGGWLYVAIRYRSKLLFFGLLWFACSFGIVSNLIPLDMTIAERWFYAPLIGLFAGLAGLLLLLADRWTKVAIVLITILFAVIPVLVIRTMIRNTNWANGLTLYTHDVKISKNSFDLENNVGVELFREGKYDEAKKHFETSIALQPDWYFTHNNLGAVYEKKGDYAKAKELYLKTLTYSDYYLAYENAASIMVFYGDAKEAKPFLEAALQKLPLNGRLWSLLSLANYKLGDKDAALAAAEKAWQLLPTNQTNYILTQLKNNQEIDFGD